MIRRGLHIVKKKQQRCTHTRSRSRPLVACCTRWGKSSPLMQIGTWRCHGAAIFRCENKLRDASRRGAAADRRHARNWTKNVEKVTCASLVQSAIVSMRLGRICNGCSEPPIFCPKQWLNFPTKGAAHAASNLGTIDDCCVYTEENIS